MPWNHHTIKITTRKSEFQIEKELGMVWPPIPRAPKIDRSIEDSKLRYQTHLNALDDYFKNLEEYTKHINENRYMLNDVYETDSDLTLRFEFSKHDDVTTMEITAINDNGATGRKVVPWFFNACNALHAITGEVEITDYDGWDHYVMTYEGFDTSRG